MDLDNRKIYDDIIDHEHYVDPDFPRMSRLNRAAQFSPFAALTGYEDLIDEAARVTDKQIELDESSKEEISRRLSFVLLSKNSFPVEITYYIPDSKKQGGSYHTIQGTILKYDEFGRYLKFNSGDIIYIDSITGISFD